MKGVKNFSIHRRNHNLLQILLSGMIILLILFVLNILLLPVKNFFFYISAPIQKIVWSSSKSSSVFLGSFLNSASIFQENENLKKENQSLLSQIAVFKSIEKGSLAQDSVLSACQNSGFEFVMAGVIGLNDDDILTINKGSDDGISEEMPVINQQNALAGKILKVYKNFSKVMLISNKNSVVNVKVQQSDVLAPEIDGVIKGSGGLSAYLDLIPVNNNINLNDVLVTSSIDKSSPKDVLVAKITQIKKDDQKPFQQAQVNLFFDVKTADNLFVITNYKKE